MMITTKRQGKPTSLVTGATVDLTLAEQRLLELFRATHAGRQVMFLGMAQDYARIFPSHTRPVLHLVSGGAV
ncbi:hypothetical protein IV454_16215 [Massilia antarctica]|uniref:Uncharacterized protein n=1 Tax=Massilia antarctica TaxID=2765360 RepID=A0AA49ABF3_9BURK|nr:hypothetical protein [Massilia antarctica]QPI52892.1 hypothetical protein IV454_16215 [Massilia antarctica]